MDKEYIKKLQKSISICANLYAKLDREIEKDALSCIMQAVSYDIIDHEKECKKREDKAMIAEKERIILFLSKFSYDNGVVKLIEEAISKLEKEVSK